MPISSDIIHDCQNAGTVKPIHNKVADASPEHGDVSSHGLNRIPSWRPTRRRQAANIILR